MSHYLCSLFCAFCWCFGFGLPARSSCGCEDGGDEILVTQGQAGNGN